MIRFVDLRYQGIQARFAFWDTVTSKFIRYSDVEAWGEWEEFVADLMDHPNDDGYEYERHRALCPEWVFGPASDEELGFREDADRQGIALSSAS